MSSLSLFWSKEDKNDSLCYPFCSKRMCCFFRFLLVNLINEWISNCLAVVHWLISFAINTRKQRRFYANNSNQNACIFSAGFATLDRKILINCIVYKQNYVPRWNCLQNLQQISLNSTCNFFVLNSFHYVSIWIFRSYEYNFMIILSWLNSYIKHNNACFQSTI